MKRLLWVGDAGVDSGFARCTHKTLEGLRRVFDVAVLGINFLGDPTADDPWSETPAYPYPIYPAWPMVDLFGTKRLPSLLRKLRPDVIVFQSDPWNFPAYIQTVEQVTDVPRPVLVGAVAVDGKNTRGWALNGLDHAIFWTEFGRYEALKGGFTSGSTDVIPLGVDLQIYSPGDQQEARREVASLGIEYSELRDRFIFLNVNRNQPRKRLDLSVRYFAEWLRKYKHRDALLYLHVAPTGDMAFDIPQLVDYYELRGHVVYATPDLRKGFSEELMAHTYRAADAQLTTTIGEGWGLTTLEGMACQRGQVVPAWAALGEWPGNAAWRVPCDPVCSFFHQLNVFGGVPDRELFVAALEGMYRDPDRWGALALDRARDPQFNWENIGTRFTQSVSRALEAAS